MSRIVKKSIKSHFGPSYRNRDLIQIYQINKRIFKKNKKSC